MPVKSSDIDRAYSRRACPVEVPGAGEATRVVFRSYSMKGFEQVSDALRDKSLTVYDRAARVVTALPDLTDEGRPVKLTRAILDRFDARFVAAMVETFVAMHTYAPPDFGRGRPFPHLLVCGEPCGWVEDWRGDD